ncbi:MAG: hypothetical protein FWE84_00430 [Firmicutes bacterium]|nr:hypothetical protein [Bacillota bacterium]
MSKKICGIVLKISYPSMGDTSDIELLGKTMLEWVTLALREDFVAALPFSDTVTLPKLLRPHLTDAEFTVVLFSDTPLITRKTVLDAVHDLDRMGENVLRMTRGYVFKTAYLRSADKVYAGDHRFFDEEDFLTAFSFKQAAMVGDMLKARILSYHLAQGVQIIDPATTRIGCDVVIGRGCVIHPDNTIGGKTVIKDEVKLLCGNIIENSVIDKGCVVEKSVIRGSLVGANTEVGPFAHLRPGSRIGAGCRIGNFVEIKNSVLGAGTKAAHLSYIGDAEIGQGCNIGCGTVFCNYDGQNKNRTVLGDRVFIGSNANLVAPLLVGDGAFVAAGSTVTQDVPAGALAVARARQANKEGWKKSKE